MMTEYQRSFRPLAGTAETPEVESVEMLQRIDLFGNRRDAPFPQRDIKANALRWLFAGASDFPLKMSSVRFFGGKRLKVFQSDKDATLERAIEESKTLLELPPDWDESGAPAISHETLNRAVKVLRNLRRLSATLRIPRILPGPDGSIDLHWKTERHEILVNIPANPDEPCDFYGDNYGRFAVKGTFDPSHPIPLLMIFLQ